MKGKRRWGVLMLVIAGLIALLMSLAVVGASAGGKGNGKKPPPEPEPEALAGSIYFNNRSTGTTWVMNPDGSNKHEVLDKTILVRYTPYDVIHDESTNTPTPLFLVNRTVENNIYPELFAVDDTGQEVQLTNLPDVRVKQLARWSPDGNYVAFSFVRGVDWQIAVGRVRDGNGLISPSTFIEMPIDGSYLAWSPDSKRLAFSHPGSQICFYSNSEDPVPFSSDLISVVTVVEGGNVVSSDVVSNEMNWTKLLDDELDCLNKGGVDWSPDFSPMDESCPSRIVFSMSPPGETRSKDLYTVCMPSGGIGLDGLVKVTSVKGRTTNGNPRWSPDGEHMVYVAYNTAKFEFDIHRIKADGSGAVNLTKDTKAGASNVGWRK